MHAFFDRVSALIRQGNVREVLRFIEARQQTNCDGIALLRQVVGTCIESGDSESICRLDGETEENSVLKPFTHYGMACVAAWDNDLGETSRRLRAAFQTALAGSDILKGDAHFQPWFITVAQQVWGIDPELDVQGEGSHATTASEANGTVAPDVPRDLTILVSCNSKYFDCFGQRFLASAAQFMPHAKVHIHLMNPTPEIEARVDTIKSAYASLSASAETCPEEETRFACGRLVIAHDIMQTRQCDVLISDIDTLFTDKTATLTALTSDYDAGLFERRNASPMETCACTLFYIRQTPAGLLFAQQLRDYVLAKLSNGDLPAWMFDQVALFVVSRRALRRKPASAWQGMPAFRWCDFSQAQAGELTAYQPAQEISQDDKLKLRYHAGIGKQFYILPLRDGGVSFKLKSAAGA